MKYIIYNATTGEVLRTLSTTIETIQLNCKANEDYIAYLGNNYDIHVELVDGVKTIMPGRIDSRTADEKSRVEWFVVRRERDKRLNDTDWVSAKMLDQTGTIKDESIAYRQALRDVTEQLEQFQIVWPVLPKI